MIEAISRAICNMMDCDECRAHCDKPKEIVLYAAKQFLQYLSEELLAPTDEEKVEAVKTYCMKQGACVKAEAEPGEYTTCALWDKSACMLYEDIPETYLDAYERIKDQSKV